MGNNGHRRPRQEYWWVWAIDPKDNRLIVLGPELTQYDATQVGFAKLGGLEFETKAIRTIDRNYAKQTINFERLGKTAELEDIIHKRAKYQV